MCGHSFAAKERRHYFRFYENIVSDVYSVSRVRDVLTRRGLAPTKARGQNFLFDRNIAAKIANTIPDGVARGSHAFEIGGGLGALTNMLLARYEAGLTVVEFDAGLYEYLRDTYPAHALLHDNVLNTRLDTVSDVYGNVPYNISSELIEWLLITNAGKWNYAAFLVQLDFAKRLTASVGDKDYSAITLLAAFGAKVRLEFKVPPTVFYPRPDVDSMVITLTPSNAYPVDDFPLFRETVRSVFHNRRKTIRNNLITSPYLSISTAIADEALSAAGIEGGLRAESLPCESIYALSHALRAVR